ATRSGEPPDRPVAVAARRRRTTAVEPTAARPLIQIPNGTPDAARAHADAASAPRSFPSPPIPDRSRAAEISAVEVIIGRIEVKAAAPPPPPRRRWSPAPMTLNDYLDRRAGRQGRGAITSPLPP